MCFKRCDMRHRSHATVPTVGQYVSVVHAMLVLLFPLWKAESRDTTS
jgi:hypothetical protein